MPDPQTTGVILLGRGSSDAGANGELAKMARWLFEDNDFELVDLAFTGVTWPRLESVVQRQARLGMTQLAIVPVYLFTGVLMERIKAQVARLRGQYPQIAFALGTHFGFDKGVFELLDAKVAGLELPEGGLLECDGCKYRQAAEAEHLHDHSHTHVMPRPRPHHPARPPPRLSPPCTPTPSPNSSPPPAAPSSTTPSPSSTPKPAPTPTPRQWPLVRRMIHANADFEFNGLTAFHPRAMQAGLARILAGGTPVVADVEMICVGLSKPRLAHFGITTHQFISDPDVIDAARRDDTTRAVQAMRKAHRLGLLEGAIVGIGNAPTALIELVRLIREEGVRPALVIGMPVGFVSAAESKDC
jgi:precorrin isomerase